MIVEGEYCILGKFSNKIFVLNMHIQQARLAVGVNKQRSFILSEDVVLTILLTNVHHTQLLLPT